MAVAARQWTVEEDKRVRQFIMSEWRQRRESLGLSRYDVAHAMGISWRSVWHNETDDNNRGVPKLTTIVRVCSALDMDPIELISQALDRAPQETS